MKMRERPRIKTGPKPMADDVHKATFVLPSELWLWAVQQKEGASGLIRKLLDAERTRRAQVATHVEGPCMADQPITPASDPEYERHVLALAWTLYQTLLDYCRDRPEAEGCALDAVVGLQYLVHRRIGL
jgi:hypothetical protein